MISEIKLFVDSEEEKVYLAMDNNAEENFIFLMMACEYLLNFAANRSPAGYDKAIELLVKGARTYKDITKAGTA